MFQSKNPLATEGSNPRTNRQAHVDRLTSLPSEVAEIILSKLPLRDAARTSVLSSPWHQRWLSQSHLVIDSHDIETSFDDGEEMRLRKIDKLIMHYLQNHQGSIKTFGLKMHCGLKVSLWMQLLSGRGVEELILEQYSTHNFELPTLILSCFCNLKSLYLKRCHLEIPATFGKLNFLIKLCLIEVSTTAKDMERMSVACPNMEKLTLLSMCSFMSLPGETKGVHPKTHWPALKYLHTDYLYEFIRIEAAPRLAVLEITHPCFRRCGMVRHRWLDLDFWLSVLRSLKNLVLAGRFIECIARGETLQRIPIGNDHPLAIYVYDVSLESDWVLTVFLTLLAMLSNLEKLDISVKKSRRSDGFKSFFLEQAENGMSFGRLRAVKMKYSGQLGVTLDFLNFVIARSPHLQSIIVIKEGNQCSERSMRAVCQQLKGSAPNTDVVFGTKDAFGRCNYFTATSFAPFYQQ